MSALHSQMKKMPRLEKLAVERDLNGGVRITIGSQVLGLSPDEAVKMAAAILKCAGVNVEFTNKGNSIIRANGELPQ
jgi:hypothetical protein